MQASTNSDPTTHLSGCLFLVSLGALFWLVNCLTTQKRHPPGPRRLPLLGNALQMPREHLPKKLAEWARIYGDITYLSLPGLNMVVINSSEVAKELLDKRSRIYSDRPHTIMLKLAAFNELFVSLPYGNAWRVQRKIVTKDFSAVTVTAYHAIQETQARKLVLNVLDNSDSLFSETKRVAAIIYRVTYGYEPTSIDDRFLTVLMASTKNFTIASMPGNFLVEALPILQYFPSWMPGSGFRRTAAHFKEVKDEMIREPLAWSVKEWEKGSAVLPNLCANVLDGTDGEMDKHALGLAAGSILGGGLDTNTAFTLSFFLAMIHNPIVQERAYQEIQAVVGSSRLPVVSDRSSLPFVRSVVAEVFRWAPPGPMGLPHAISSDDVYEGMEIPSGSMILANVWYMLHDPKVFPNPDAFDPDRYLGVDEKMTKVTDVVFGFGRRVCPGYHLATATAFAMVVTVLATCEILPVGPLPPIEFEDGGVMFPVHFKCRLKPRTDHARELLCEAVNGL